MWHFWWWEKSLFWSKHSFLDSTRISCVDPQNPLPSNLFLSREVVASNLVDIGPPNNRKRVSSLPSPSKSKRLATATATSAAKKSVPSSKKAATKPLSSLGFSSSKRLAVQIGTGTT
jgi:hypothetical protein